jgi:integral membrane protein
MSSVTDSKTKLTPKRLFNILAFAEAVTWSLLIAGLIARATIGIPAELFTLVGGTHGLVFLSYGVMAALVGVNNRWHIAKTVLAVGLAIVPFATVPFERFVSKRGLLEGSWRTEESADPRDNNWFDSLYRWFIKRPALLFVVLIVVVAIIFATLLFLGPPGGSKN